MVKQYTPFSTPLNFTNMNACQSLKGILELHYESLWHMIPSVIFWWLPWGWKPSAIAAVAQAFKTHTHHVTSDTDAGNPIRKARDHEIIGIYVAFLNAYAPRFHFEQLRSFGGEQMMKKGLVVEYDHQKTSHVPCIIPSHIQILLWSNLIRFHPRLTEPSQVVSMMEKMVGDLVGEQFDLAKNRSHSSLSVGIHVTLQIRSKVVDDTQSSTRSIKFFAHSLVLVCDPWAISMTQWHWISGILLSLKSRPRRLRRKANPKKISMRSLSSKPSDGFGDMDRKWRIACREHSWWKVSDLESFKLKWNRKYECTSWIWKAQGAKVTPVHVCWAYFRFHAKPPTLGELVDVPLCGPSLVILRSSFEKCSWTNPTTNTCY